MKKLDTRLGLEVLHEVLSRKEPASLTLKSKKRRPLWIFT